MQNKNLLTKSKSKSETQSDVKLLGTHHGHASKWINTTLEYVQEIQVNQKQVDVEAIDFDWVFKDDNAKILIQLLAENAKQKLLIQKPFRVFI